MILAAAAIRPAIAGPATKGAPMLAGVATSADFALVIAGTVGDNGAASDDPIAALNPPVEDDDDRHGDAEGGTILPDAAPTLDPALAWLPFAPVEVSPPSIVTTPPALTPSAVVPTAKQSKDIAPPSASAPANARAVAADPTNALTPPPAAPAPMTEPAKTTIPQAVATSSLTPIPPIAPRDTPVAKREPIANASGLAAPAMPDEAAPSIAVQTDTFALPAATVAVDTPKADAPVAVAQPSGRAAVPVASEPAAAPPSPAAAPTIAVEPRVPLASMIRAAIAEADPAPADAAPRIATSLPVPARFQSIPVPPSQQPQSTTVQAAAAVPTSAARPEPTATVQPAGQAMTAPMVGAQMVPTAEATVAVAPPARSVDTLVAVTPVSVMPVGTLTPAATPVIAVAAPAPVAPDVLRGVEAVAATPPAAPLPALAAAPVQTATSLALQVFGAAIRAAASDDKPAAATIAVDPLASAPAPVADLGTVAAPASTAGDAQHAPLDLSHQRWPHAMIDRIEQLRDAANATDTRIRLVPDALGVIDVSVRQDGDTTHVRFTAEQAATRALIQDAAPRLAAAAEDRGIKLTQSTPDTGTNPGAQQQPQQRQQQAQAATPNRARTTTTDADVDADDRIA